jgi:ATP-dependent RNA helicase RhlE
MHFAELKLNDTLLAAVAAEGYTVPTAIQQKAIPEVLAGHDLVGLAQTGTGKTAAFALPILHRLMLHLAPGPRRIRVLVLAPTRELASQIEQSFATYGRGSGQRATVIFGGVGQDKQARALREGVDILVATPGRLLDLMGQGLVDFHHLEVLVLDEADRMLDMGFIHDVRRIVQKVPAKRQTLLFSATMPPDVKQLAASLLTNPARVEAHPVSSTAERIEQSVYLIERGRKRSLLQHLLSDPAVRRALVFTRTKQGANRVAEFLTKVHIQAEAIHGNKSQGARERALAHFVSGETRVLVATDIAARGIDIEDISHIVNFDLPNIPETYVHRIGRTARAGAAGIALSFCDTEERPYLADIEKLTGRVIPRAPIPASLPQPPPDARPPHTTSRPAHHPKPHHPQGPRSPKEARHRAKALDRQKQHGQRGSGSGHHPHGTAHGGHPPRPEQRAPHHAPRHVTPGQGQSGHAGGGTHERPSHAMRQESQARPQGQRSWRNRR